MNYILLIIWFILLIKWADMLVEWWQNLAKKFWVSSLVIWLTVVAFWTSAPEFVVSFMASLKWKTDLAIANVVWSNIANIALVLWLTALIHPVLMPKSTVRKEIPFAIIISFLLIILVSDVSLFWAEKNSLWFIDWIILIIFFGYFLYYSYKISKNKTWNEKKENNEEKKEISISKSSIFILLWLIWLIYWWDLIVKNATIIAKTFWLSDAFIWVTIIAIGTSLPEIASSIMAAIKKDTDMAIWWIIWSNIFNILWILWFSSLFFTLDWYNWVIIDLFIVLFCVVLLLIFAFLWRKFILTRFQGGILLNLYVVYILYLIYNL